MIKAGLVTVSFRSLSPKEVVDLAAEAGLELLEWGGDIHVPPTDPENARQVAVWTKEAGLTTAAYGSYYRLGTNKEPEKAFAPILETAIVLNAPVIRIWGGTKGSADLDETERVQLAKEGRLLVKMAAEKGIRIALECHADTLTDHMDSTLRYLQEVPGMTMYWQPNQFYREEYNRRAAAALAPYTTNVHVFQWDAANAYPLCEGEEIWSEYLANFTDGDHGLLLEFMYDGSPDSLKGEAETLRGWIKKLQG